MHESIRAFISRRRSHKCSRENKDNHLQIFIVVILINAHGRTEIINELSITLLTIHISSYSLINLSFILRNYKRIKKVDYEFGLDLGENNIQSIDFIN